MDIFQHYVIVLLAIARYVGGLEPPFPAKCVHVREYRMLVANCKWQHFLEVPQDLNKNIEILVASSNRIRQLSNNNFKSYTSLRFLYLDDNFITNVEDETFVPLTELEVLDLSTNAIVTLPELMPYLLRRLYLSNNPIEHIHLSEAFHLQFLALGDCSLKELPDLGILPNLQELNISGNPLVSLTSVHLASLCHLKVLHVPKSLYQKYPSQCNCSNFLSWISENNINVGNFTCTALEHSEDRQCYSNRTLEMAHEKYSSCLIAEQKRAWTKFIMVGLILLVTLTAFIVVLCCCRRRKRRHKPTPSLRSNVTQQHEKKFDTLIL